MFLNSGVNMFNLRASVVPGTVGNLGCRVPRNAGSLEMGFSCLQPLLAPNLWEWCLADPGDDHPAYFRWLGFLSSLAILVPWLNVSLNHTKLQSLAIPMILSFPHARQDGYATLARLAARMKLRLWKIRPKLHMFCHLQLLSGDIILVTTEHVRLGPTQSLAHLCSSHVSAKARSPTHAIGGSMQSLP